MELPNLSAQARPMPNASQGVARYQPEDMSAATAPGRALSDLGDQVGQMAEKEMARVDTLRAEDALNKLRRKQQDLTLGQEGFVNKKGEDAITKPLLPDYSGKFDEASAEISQGLSNQRQKDLFRQRADMVGLQFRDEVMRHVVREGDVYAEQVFKGAAETEKSNVAANWDKPDAVALSTTRIDALIKQRADSQGWSPEFTSAVRLQQLGDLHEAVIEQALGSKNYIYAQDWFNQHKDQMDVKTLDRLGPQVENGLQKQLTNGYNTRYLAVMNDSKAIGALEKEVTADSSLDDEHKNILIGRLQSRSELLANRAERYQAQKDRKLQAGIAAMNNLSLQGFEPTVEQMAPLVDEAKGTAYEPLVKQMIAVADTTRAFRQSPPAQQEAYLTQLEASARKDPTKFDVTMISRLRQIHDNQKELIAKDPTSFAIRQGLIDTEDAASKPLDLTHPETLGDQLQARFDLGRSMQQRYGAPLKPLTVEETALVTKALANAPVQQRRDFIAQLSAATQNDRPGYSAILAQIAPDDPVTAIAGLRAPKYPQAADLMLQGQAILQPPRKSDGTPEGGKLWPMPAPDKFDLEFKNLERDAFAGHPQARNGYYQSTRAIYAALSAKAGDATGDINPDRVEEAFKMATGGVEKYNGKATVMPYGMKKGDFEDQLDARLQYLANSGALAQGMSHSKLSDLPLDAIGEGRYVLRAGDGILVDKQNKPVIIDFTQPAVPESANVKKIPK